MTEAAQAGHPPFLNSCLRIFLSVDIVGSTNFKQLLAAKGADDKKATSEDASHPGKKWLFPILEFYDQMTTRFIHEWHALSTAANTGLFWAAGDPPQLWKAVGDELIFTKPLKDHKEAFVCVAALLSTVLKFRDVIKTHSRGLDLKCAAWIAGFPVNNAEVVLSSLGKGDDAIDDGDFIFANLQRLHRTYEDSAGVRDYIGPSIDTGFRVASLASPRKFVLTADLALMLATVSSTMPATSNCLPRLEYYYEGRVPLKGVTNGLPYPIFWVNAADKTRLVELEDDLEGREPIRASLVKEYCEHFVEKQEGTHIIRPYIVSDADPMFRHMPSEHEQKLSALGQYWLSESSKRDLERRAAQEDGTDAPHGPDMIDRTRPEGNLASDPWTEANKLIQALSESKKTSDDSVRTRLLMQLRQSKKP